jgi:YVTN family beta-propeller protein
MLVNLPSHLRCYCLVTLATMFGSHLHASVAYIVNCCNNPSTVTVVDTASGQPRQAWTVGEDATAAVFSPDGATAYISDTISESVTVIDAATGATLATIPVGYQISSLAVSASLHRLFAVSYDYAYVSHIVSIDTITNTVLQATEFAAFLGPMVVSPDGRKIYINSSFSAQPGVLVVDAAFLNLTATIPMGAANGIAISPDGRFVYVPNLGSGQPYNPNVAVIDTATNLVTATVPLDTHETPGPAQVSPDGSMLWVSEFPLYTTFTAAVAVISTVTNRIVGSFTLLAKETPDHIVFEPNGKIAWVVAGGAAVDVVEVAQLTAVAEINTVGGVGQPAVSPDGNTLLLPNGSGSQVAAVGESTGARLASILVGAMDWSNSQLFDVYGGAAASPDGSRVYVTNYASGNVSIIDTASKSVMKSVEVGASPVGIVISPDGSKAYVANSGSNSVTVIDTKTFAVQRIGMPPSYYTYPSSIAITPDGSHLYVAGNNPMPDFGKCDCFVFVVDTSSNQVVDSIPLQYPMALTVSPDGKSVYVAAGLTNLSTISTSTNTITNKLFVADNGPEQPVTGGIAVTPDGTRVFLDDGADNRIFEVDVTQNKVVATIRAGSTPGILAVTPDGTEVWAGDYYATYASVIDIASGAVTRTIPLGSQSYGIAFAPQ